MQFVQAARRQVVRAFVFLGLGILVAGCGGGGGGGNGASSAGVSVTLAPTAPIQAKQFEGTELPHVPLQVIVGGDIATLNGKTLYVFVEDPSALFQSTPFVSISQSPPGAALSLVGSKLTVPGHYQGNLKIHACLDSGCSTELAGSPMAVPYDVTVLTGLALDAQPLTITLPFGQIPPVQTLSVGLPEEALVSWGVRDVTTYNPYEPGASMGVTSTTVGSSPTGVVSLALDPAVPGTYTRTALVYSNVEPANGFPLHFEKTVTVTYTVTPDPSVDYVFAPAAGNYTRVQGDPLTGYTYRTLVTNTGVTATWRGVEYLSHPAAAEGHPDVNHWWLEFPYQGTSICSSTIDSSNCLPVGTYTARVRYTLTKDGVDRDVYWPITMEILAK